MINIYYLKDNIVSNISENKKLNDVVSRATFSTNLTETRLKNEKKVNFLGRFIQWFIYLLSKTPPSWAVNHHKITAQMETLIKRMQIEGQDKDELEASNKLLQKCKELDKEIVNKFGSKILKLFPMTYIDKNQLFSAMRDKEDFSMPKDHEKWHEHLGLLMNTYFATSDPDMRKKIAFLASNYLAKAAGLRSADTPIPLETSNTYLQKGLFEDVTYHREDSEALSLLKNRIQEKMIKPMHAFLTDNKHIEKVLPLRFFVVPTNSEDWTNSLVKKMTRHMDDGLNLNDFLKPPILFDLTPFMEELIFTHGKVGEKEDFDIRLKKIEAKIDQCVIETVKRLKIDHPEIDEERLKAYMRANIGCVCRSEVDNIGVLTSLPVFDDAKYFICSDETSMMGIESRKAGGMARSLLQARSGLINTRLGEFLDVTGERLGAVKGRKALFDFMSLNEVIYSQRGYEIVEYAVKGKNEIYYPNKESLTNTELFKRCSKNFNEQNPDQPYLKVLGKSTLDLLDGFLGKIDKAEWEKLNNNEDTRQLFQTSLFRIMQHLANADMNRQNFGKFAEEIEMIHYEIADLLAIVAPYQEGNFDAIYKQRIQENIPKELQGNVQVGLSKSAMNTFAGVNVALMDLNPNPEKVHGELVYYEEEQFLGKNRSLDEILGNNNIEKVDLYVGEFNHNITTRPEHDKYIAPDVIGDITKLLTLKPNTEHMTVSLDCTIDFLSSDNVKKVLQHFSKEIQEGKLNFVIFRSGQKFDMMGMDNYYGSPFYIINNGDKHWDSFKTLNQDQAFKTDDLSRQWFCLINDVAPSATDEYRHLICQNTREILKNVPEELQPGKNPTVKVCQIDDQMLPAFIDIKIMGDQPAEICDDIQKMFIQKFRENNAKIHAKSSFGFFYPNINAIRGPDGRLRNIRINPGANPAEVKLMLEVLQEVAEKYGQAALSE